VNVGFGRNNLLRCTEGEAGGRMKGLLLGGRGPWGKGRHESQPLSQPPKQKEENGKRGRKNRPQEKEKN